MTHPPSDFAAIDVTLVAARGANGVIGADGGLPWRLSGDLRRFKAATLGRPVLMGRKTWDSIGRPLPGRDNLVVTRDGDFRPDGAWVFSGIDAALAAARARALVRGAGEVCVIGGAQIYALTMAHATRLLVTDVDAAPAGDAHFPAIDPALWRIARETAHPAGPKDDHACVERLWVRV
jgi:dihydrofolate reductase